MKWQSILLVLVVALFVSAPAFATTITATMDSSSFAYQQNDATANADFSGIESFSDDGGGIWGYSNGSALHSPTWAAMGSTLVSQGYTVEFRARVDANGDAYGLGLMTAQGSTPGSQLNWMGARLGATEEADNVFAQYSPTLTEYGGGSNRDDFHIFRVGKVAGDATYSIWKDGNLLTEAAELLAGDWTVTTFNFGVISQSAGNGQIDYMRWTPGAYAPVIPEPSTLALLVAGLVGLLAYAWRKR